MSTTDDVILRVERVSRTFGETRAVDEVSFEVRRGEVVALVGPSGSGKSTLVRCIQQLESIDHGSIFIGDQLLGYAQTSRGLRPLSPANVARQRRLVSMVFQSFQLFPHMTAGQNIAEAPVRFGMWTRADAPALAKKLLDQFELGHKVDSYPTQLSGGQQQRVAIARALALEPELLMLDEPTSALDAASVSGVERVVAELASTGTTMLIVTHQIDFAQRSASRFIRMANGRITAQGSVDQLVETRDDVPQTHPVDTITLATRGGRRR